MTKSLYNIFRTTNAITLMQPILEKPYKIVQIPQKIPFLKRSVFFHGPVNI